MITAEEACRLSDKAKQFNETEFRETLESLSNQIRLAAIDGQKQLYFATKRMYVREIESKLTQRNSYGPAPGAIFCVNSDDISNQEPNEFVLIQISWHKVA